MKIDEKRRKRLVDSLRSSSKNIIYWQMRMGWKSKNAIYAFVSADGKNMSPERIVELENAMREEGELLEENSVLHEPSGTEEELQKIIARLVEIVEVEKDLRERDNEPAHLRSFYVEQALRSVLRKMRQPDE